MLFAGLYLQPWCCCRAVAAALVLSSAVEFLDLHIANCKLHLTAWSVVPVFLAALLFAAMLGAGHMLAVAVAATAAAAAAAAAAVAALTSANAAAAATAVSAAIFDRVLLMPMLA